MAFKMAGWSPFMDNRKTKKAKKRKTGARALRSILEEAMVDIMFESPSKNNINSCIITDDVINNHSNPIYKLIKKKT